MLVEPRDVPSSAPDARSSQAFSRSRRLLAKEDFGRVFRAGSRLGQNGCAAHVAPGHAAVARLGLSVPKKQVPQATARNRLKRLIRESFRQQRHLQAVDVVVVVYRSALELDNRDFLRTLEQLWLKVNTSSDRRSKR